MTKKVLSLLILINTLFFATLRAQKREAARYIVESAISKGVDNSTIYSLNLGQDSVIFSKLFVSSNKLFLTYMYYDEGYFLTSYRSTNGGKEWSTNSRSEYVNDTGLEHFNSFYNSLSLFDELPIYLFYGTNHLNYCIKQRSDSDWFVNKKLTVGLSDKNSVIGVIKGSESNSDIYFNSVDNAGDNHIFKISSTDGGYSWNTPKVAVKDNAQPLKAWCVETHHSNNALLYMILTDNNDNPYISVSRDGGKSWSYPERLPLPKGKDYMFRYEQNSTVIVYTQQENNVLGDIGDVMLWQGRLQPLLNNESTTYPYLNIRCIKHIDKGRVNDWVVESFTHFKGRKYFVLYRHRRKVELQQIVL